MAIKTKADIMQAIKDKMGENIDDDTISLIEDINDTIDDYDERLKTVGDWKQKYEENDKAWRNRYRDRFFSGEDSGYESDEEIREKESRAYSYEDLFSTDKREEVK